MELQIALDFDFDYCKSSQFIAEIAPYVDIVEAGTPFLMEEGIGLLEKLKKDFPDKKLFADLKIADAGFREAENAFLAGADMVSVLAAMDNATILGVQEAAQKYGRSVLVDMVSVANLEERLKEIDAMGVDYICLHTSKDLQKLNGDVSQAFSVLRRVVRHSKVAIAGGISTDNIDEYAAIKPDVIVVGEGITQAKDPREATARIRLAMVAFA